MTVKPYYKLTRFLLEKNAKNKENTMWGHRKMEALSLPGRDTLEGTKSIIILLLNFIH